MDAYNHQRRFPSSGDAPPPPPPTQPPPSHTNPHWYPGPAPPPYPPPHANHPFPPQHHQWGPPHDLQHQRHPPPPYGYHPSLPPMSMQPPPPPPPPAAANPWPPHHAAAQPPPPSYPPPPPGQAWANHSWAQNHGYTGHGNEEDWATKAKAWAAAKSVTENHHIQQHAISTNRPEVHNYGYQDQYQQPAGLPAEPLRPPIPQSSNDHLLFAMKGQHRETNYLPDGGPLMPPAKNIGSFPSTYEQEVPYNYSSTPGVGNAMIQYPSSQTQPPPTASTIQDGFPQAASSMHIAPSLEQPHFGHDGQSSKIVVDPSDQPLEFNSRKAPDMTVHRTTNFNPIAPSDHDADSAATHSWVPSTTVLFPQSSVPPQAAQMDPSVHAAPLFGAVSGSSYVPPAAFGVGNVMETFPVDASTPFSVAERSKKPPVPTWLREELLKKKSTSASASVQHSTEFHSTGSEDAEKTLKIVDQAESRSLDSVKSTDDDEDDEDEIEAARMAAINQEIKRVLTEVLLKVTDDLFDEIATKVLNEDDSSAEPNEPTRVSSVKGPGLGESKPMVAAKVVLPAKTTNASSANHSDCTELSSPKGALLGLASYDSDDEDDEGDAEDKVPASNLSETKAGTAHPEEGEKASDGEQRGNHNERNSAVQNSSSGEDCPEDRKVNDEMFHGGSTTELKQELHSHDTHSKEFPSDVKISSQPKDVVPTMDEKTHVYFQNGKVPSSGIHAENYSDVESGHRHLGKSSHQENYVNEPKAVRRKEPESSSKRYNDDGKSSMYGNIDKKGSFKEEKGSDSSAKHGADTRESCSRGNFKQDDAKGDRKDYQKDIREKSRASMDRREKEKGKHDKEDRSRQITRGSSSHTSRRSRSPSARSRTKESSHRESVSSDEPSENAKRRKLHSRKSSMSPSPPKSRNRRISRSPHSKHSHRRHSPHSSAERKKRSRSRTPVKRR
ncbi:arginine/serine-rich protein PNISR isoform X2 [Oryza brachyantha]|nr:arginine/serine-rich protein PNISR isoform X2 [Oryza brachyantha]